MCSKFTRFEFCNSRRLTLIRFDNGPSWCCDIVVLSICLMSDFLLKLSNRNVLIRRKKIILKIWTMENSFFIYTTVVLLDIYSFGMIVLVNFHWYFLGKINLQTLMHSSYALDRINVVQNHHPGKMCISNEYICWYVFGSKLGTLSNRAVVEKEANLDYL